MEILYKWCNEPGKLQTEIIKTVLGTFKTELEAAQVYNEKATELFGEYARLNVLEEEVDELFDEVDNLLALRRI